MSEAVIDIVSTKLNAMADRLVDLSGRNRLISYSERKVSTVRLQDVDIDSLYSDDARAHGYRFWFPDAADDSEPYDDQLAAVRRRIGRGEQLLISSDQDGGALRKRLRALAGSAREYREERSLHVLYLSVGMLEWRDERVAGGEKRRSPLILIPVNLERASIREDFQLAFVDDDPVVNPALAIAIERQGTLPDDFGWEEDKGLREELGDIERFAQRNGWSVSPEVRLDIFTFHKLAMYEDLKANEGMVLDSALARLVTTGRRERSEGGDGAASEVAPAMEDPDTLSPRDVGTVLDCDSSQLRCVLRARNGDSFVIQGPPGTGKSQTIANIIADSLARGKSVLFVSEKAAALDVVYKRLSARGLADFVLDLHSDKIKRKELLDELDRRMRYEPRVGRSLTFDEHKYRASRQQLIDVTEALVKPSAKLLGRTPFDAHGTAASLVDAPVVTGFPKALELDQVDLDRLSLLLERFGVSLVEARRAARYWNGYRGSADADSLAEVRGLLQSLKKAAIERSDAVRRVLELTGIAVGSRDNDLTEVARLLDVAAGIPDVVIDEWMDGRPPATIRDAIATARRAHEAVVDRMATVATQVRLADDHVPLTEIDALCGALTPLGNRPLTAKARRHLLGRLGEVIEVYSRLGSAVEAARVSAEAVCSVFGIHEQEEDLAIADRLGLSAGLIFDQPVPMQRIWLEEIGRNRSRQLVDGRRDAIEQYRSAMDRLQGAWSEQFFELDPAPWTSRLRQATESFWTRIGSQHRTDIRELREMSRGGSVTRDSALEALADLQSCRALRAEIESSTGEIADALGPFWNGVDTDIAQLDRALDVAASFEKALGPLIHGAGDRIVALCGSVQDVRIEPSRVAAEHSDRRAELQVLLETAATWIDDDMRQMSASGVLRQRIVEVSAELAQIAAGHACWVAIDGAGDLPIEEALRLRDGMHELDQANRQIAQLQRQWSDAIGPGYVGPGSDWRTLAAGAEWVEELRREFGEWPVPKSLRATVRNPGGPGLVRELAEQARAASGVFLQALERVCELSASAEVIAAHAIEPRSTLMETRTVAMKQERVAERVATELEQQIHYVDAWVRHRDLRALLVNEGVGQFADQAIPDEVIVDEALGDSFRRAFWSRQLANHYASEPRLQNFDPNLHADAVERFRELDRQLVESTPAEVAKAIAANAPAPTVMQGTEQEVLHSQARAKRKTLSVRKLLHRLPTLLPRLKPCLMMSPLSVSTFLSSETRFDVVIFDEASQVKPEDAINCVYRGRQLIVAGDEKQLPPTAFFATSVDGPEGDDLDDDDGIAGADDLESILAVCGGAMPTEMLRWHYRSKDESLIGVCPRFGCHLT